MACVGSGEFLEMANATRCRLPMSTTSWRVGFFELREAPGPDLQLQLREQEDDDDGDFDEPPIPSTKLPMFPFRKIGAAMPQPFLPRIRSTELPLFPFKEIGAAVPQPFLPMPKPTDFKEATKRTLSISRKGVAPPLAAKEPMPKKSKLVIVSRKTKRA